MRRTQWQLIRPFLLLSLLLILLMGGLAFWFFDLGDRPGTFFLYLVSGSSIGLLIAVIYSLAVSKRLITPLRHIIRSVEKIAEGTFEHPIRLESDFFQALEERFNEMTERLQSRIQFLSEDRLKILSILSDMVEGVLVLDANGRIVMVNTSFEKIFDVNQETLIGSYHYEKLRHHALNELVEAVIETGQARACEISLDFPQTQHLIVQASVAHPFEKGSVVLVFHDITEKKRQEAIQTDFVANISHELRTPIAIIKGYLETLVDGGIDDPKQTKDFIKVLQKNSTRMEQIVEDLLQLSRIESGRDPTRPVKIVLKDDIEKIVALLKPLAEKKSQMLTVDIPDDLKIFADSEKMNHVISNLLDNAIKYTGDAGSIRISAYDKDDAIEIQIEDNGMGIPKRDLTRIFERFYRVDRTRSRELGGTGLGLSIVKQIVESHGGTVSVKSRPSKGTRFTLTFFNDPKI